MTSVKLTETPKKRFLKKKSFNSNSPISKMKDPCSSEAVLKTSGKDHFVPFLEGQNRREHNHSNFSRLKTSLSGPESDWHCSQEHLLMVTVGRQDTEPSAALILTQHYLMHVLFIHCTLQNVKGTSTFRLLNL